MSQYNRINPMKETVSWAMEVILEPFIPPNDAPTIVGISSYYEVEPMKQTLLKLGELTDADEDQRQIKSFEVTPTAGWIKLVNKLRDTSVKQVDLSVVPPNLAINQTYIIQIVVEEVGTSSPKSTQHELKIFV